MKQIKTIVFRLIHNKDFDTEVNVAIIEGWELKKRTVIVPKAQSDECSFYNMLYAELEKEIDI